MKNRFSFRSGHLADSQLQWPEETDRVWKEHLPDDDSSAAVSRLILP